MGIIKSKLIRPFKTYNIGHRAQKIISQEKPKAAPYYPSVYEQIKVAKEASPNFLEEHHKKDSDLYARLKDIFVTSDKIENPQIQRKEEKVLPYSTITPDSFEFGFWEPENISDGRCRLKEIILMVADHTTKKEEHSSQELAKKYKLDIQDVENILEYIRVLQVFEKPSQELDFSDQYGKLPSINMLSQTNWKTIDVYEKWKEQREEEEAKIEKENKTQKNNKSEVSQMDTQTESSRKVKITDSSYRDKETSSQIVEKKELSNK